MQFSKKLNISLSLLLLPAVCQAFKLSPMVINFAPAANKSTQVLTLENPGSDKVPVQIEAFSRGIDAKGEETRIRTTDFNVYPEQVVLLPNEKRNVRVTWSGEVKAVEKAYRIIVTQLPVEFKETNAKSKKPGVNLNFLLQYVASAYVTPEGAVAKVKVKSVEALGTGKVQVTLVNEGNAHRVLHLKRLTFLSGKNIVAEISKSVEIEGLNLLANSEKKISLTVAKDVPKDVKAELELAEFGD